MRLQVRVEGSDYRNRNTRDDRDNFEKNHRRKKNLDRGHSRKAGDKCREEVAASYQRIDEKR